MWSRFYKENYLPVVYYLGVFVIALGVMMLVPCIVALLASEPEHALNFFLSAAICWAVGSLMRFASLHPRGINQRQALVAVGVIWVVASAAGALPLFFSGYVASYLDAMFDAVSGFTDTGVAVIGNMNHLPYSVNLWRHIMQLIGGVGIVVIVLGIGSFAKFSGSSLLIQAEGRTDQIFPTLAKTSRFMVLATTVFVISGIVGCTLALIGVGFSPIKALYHAASLSMTAFSTGGFSPMSSGTIYYHSPALEVVLMVVMCSGMFSFALYGYMLRSRPSKFLRDIEVRTIVIWLALVMMVFSASIAYDPLFEETPFAAMRRGLFIIISAGSNTGFSSFYNPQISSLLGHGAIFAVILAMGMAGAANSTTGGIKAIRVALTFLYLMKSIKAALLPASARSVITYNRLGTQYVKDSDMRNVLSVFLLFLIAYLFGAAVGVYYGYQPLDAIFESVSVTSNAGLSTGVTATSMPIVLKVVYIILMLAGRLEFITLFAMLAGIFLSTSQRIGERVQSYRPSD